MPCRAAAQPCGLIEQGPQAIPRQCANVLRSDSLHVLEFLIRNRKTRMEYN